MSIVQLKDDNISKMELALSIFFYVDIIFYNQNS